MDEAHKKKRPDCVVEKDGGGDDEHGEADCAIELRERLSIWVQIDFQVSLGLTVLFAPIVSART